MKTGLAKSFVISLNFPCLSLFTELFVYVVLLVVLWLGICVEVAVYRISRTSIYPPPSLPPSVFFLILPMAHRLFQNYFFSVVPFYCLFRLFFLLFLVSFAVSFLYVSSRFLAVIEILSDKQILCQFCGSLTVGCKLYELRL